MWPVSEGEGRRPSPSTPTHAQPGTARHVLTDADQQVSCGVARGSLTMNGQGGPSDPRLLHECPLPSWTVDSGRDA